MALSNLTVAELKDLADKNGVTLSEGMKKSEIVAALEAANVAEPGAGKKFRVELLAPTPLGKNPLVVEANDEDGAKAAFNAANGIRGSRQTYRVREANADDVAEQQARDNPEKEPTPAPAPTPTA